MENANLIQVPHMSPCPWTFCYRLIHRKKTKAAASLVELCLPWLHWVVSYFSFKFVKRPLHLAIGSLCWRHARVDLFHTTIEYNNECLFLKDLLNLVRTIMQVISYNIFLVISLFMHLLQLVRVVYIRSS